MYSLEADLAGGGIKFGTTGNGINHNWNKDEKVASVMTVLGEIEVNLHSLEAGLLPVVRFVVY